MAHALASQLMMIPIRTEKGESIKNDSQGPASERESCATGLGTRVVRVSVLSDQPSFLVQSKTAKRGSRPSAGSFL